MEVDNNICVKIFCFDTILLKQLTNWIFHEDLVLARITASILEFEPKPVHNIHTQKNTFTQKSAQNSTLGIHLD